MDRDTLFEVFKKAIVAEHEACEFYTRAAAETSNGEAKKLFESFAATERNHKSTLEELYKSLKQ